MAKRKRKKKQKSGSSILWLLLLIAICSCVTLYQDKYEKASKPNSNNTESASSNTPGGNKGEKQTYEQPSLQTEDEYIKQATAAHTPEVLLNHLAYTVSFNPDTRVANWVAWRLTPDRLVGDAQRSSNFFPDPNLPQSKAVTTRDYTGSGWDRGHLCPAGDNKWNYEAMMESFYMTNICPQHHNLNRGDWNELEQKCRKWVKKDSCLYIVAGPIFYNREPRYIGEHNVAVPDAFFKVILCLHKKPKAIGFIYKNNEGNKSLDSYVNSIDAVERITGIDFFPALPDEVEREVEATYNLKDWR